MRTRTKLRLSRLRAGEKVQLARQIVLKMTGNPAFVPPAPAPIPALAEVTAAADGLEAACNEARAARAMAKEKTATQYRKERAVSQLLGQLAAYVESVSAGDAEQILSAGMPVREPKGASAIPEQVQALAASAGAAEGEIVLNWRGVRGTRARSYVVEMASESEGPWKTAAVVTASKAKLTGLTPGERLWFRVAAVGPAGRGPWSDPATRVVA